MRVFEVTNIHEGLCFIVELSLKFSVLEIGHSDLLDCCVSPFIVELYLPVVVVRCRRTTV